MQDLISALHERINFHRKQMAIYLSALAAAEQDKSQSAAKNVLQRWGTPKEPVEPPSFGGYPTRRDYVLSLVLSHNGLDPSQIRDITRQAGIHVTGNYPYDQLKKLVARGEAELVNGQYFASDDPNKARTEVGSEEPAPKSGELPGGG
jgi:hypothetical protein